MIDSKSPDFIGTWKLVSIETRNKDGQIFRRGKRIGYLMYNEEGYMSVAFMKENRPNSLIARLIRPEEIAALVAFVCSPLSSAINGACLRVDGGLIRSAV